MLSRSVKHHTINAHARSAMWAWTFCPHTQREKQFSWLLHCSHYNRKTKRHYTLTILGYPSDRQIIYTIVIHSIKKLVLHVTLSSFACSFRSSMFVRICLTSSSVPLRMITSLFLNGFWHCTHKDKKVNDELYNKKNNVVYRFR